MDFNVGDRVITCYGAGVIVKTEFPNYDGLPYLVVLDEHLCFFHNENDPNLPLNSCWWFSNEEMRKEVDSNV